MVKCYFNNANDADNADGDDWYGAFCEKGFLFNCLNTLHATTNI